MVEELKRFLSTPHWKRQHRWRHAIWAMMSRLGLSGMYALPLNKRWIEFHRRSMPMTDLDPSLDGFRIVQISDLHYSPVVWGRYLVQMMRWVNDLQPNLVVVTGDLITGGYQFNDRVAKILSGLKTTHGVICTFGNHDYSVHGKNKSPESIRRGNALEKSLKARGLIVLRNQVHRVASQANHQKKSALTIVGLDDEWSGHIDPKLAFAEVDANEAVLCLNHNPANVKELMEFPWQWMLAGHTHGRQVATSRFGQRFYPHRYRHYTHGYYCVDGRHLYVNRGLSYGQRTLHWCRPEVTVFKLKSVPQNQC